jgi:hypothetical protein
LPTANRNEPKGEPVNDREITAKISELVDQEHQLERAHVGRPLSEDEHAQMNVLNVQLDQCWDLLRQRRARREMGQNPDDTKVRADRVVEGYQQ